MKLDGKTVIITGATSGIGLETAIAIARQNACMVLPVRNMAKGGKIKKQIIDRSDNPAIYLMEFDLASFDSIRKFASEFKRRFSRLHVLVNNAGLWERKRKETADGIEMHFGVNHLAPFLLTNLLLDVLKAAGGSRVINVSSEAHRYTKMNLDDPEGKRRFSFLQAYGQSKLANILFTRELAIRLAGDDISVNCLHPGVVATNLFDSLFPFLKPLFKLFMISPQKGAETTIYLATTPELNGVTGEYFVRKKLKKPSSSALDVKAAEKLWELSREYTGSQHRLAGNIL